MLGEFPANPSIDPLTDVMVVNRGFAYTNCLYVTPQSRHDVLLPDFPQSYIPLPPLNLPPSLIEPIDPPR